MTVHVDPKRTHFSFWGFLRLCQFWGKLIKKCDRQSAHNEHTDKRKPFFNNLPHVYMDSYGADNNYWQ